MAGVGAKSQPTPASQRASAIYVKISKVWAIVLGVLTLELRGSHIKAELGEFVQGD
jgi:hypothetical protein